MKEITEKQSDVDMLTFPVSDISACDDGADACDHDSCLSEAFHTADSCRCSDAGFSMMELTVVVSIVGIIVAIALIVMGNVQDSARQAVVDTAARDANVLAQANVLNGDPTAGDLSSVESDDVVVTMANTFIRGDESTVCVRADWVGGPNYAVSGPCDDGDITSPIFDRDPEDSLYTTMTYQCPTTRSGYLGIINISDDARVQIWDNNDRENTLREVFYDAPDENFDLRYEPRQEIFRARLAEHSDIDTANQIIDDIMEDTEAPADAEEWSIENTINNVSEVVEMERGVTYSVRFDGEVETFSAPGHRGFGQGNEQDSLADCLVSVDHFGEDSGLKNVSYLGGVNLESVPDNLPPTVGSLRGAFENATSFNDPSISSWDTSNVYSMQSAFYRAERFNQPLNDWDTSNVRYLAMMFHMAENFNQPLDQWDTSKVTNFGAMFRYSAFNSSVSGWDVSSTDNISSLFRDTPFNQPLDDWDTGNIKNMAYVFYETPFNQDISHWDVSSVERHGAFASALDDANSPF